jgi:O-antigen/teichoic acid export membrane protein
MTADPIQENLNSNEVSNKLFVPPLDARQSLTRPSITNSSKWVLAGTLLSKPVQLFTIIMLARLLGPASFGVFGLASSLAVTLSLIASLGLGDAISKYVAEYYLKDQSRGARFASVIVWTALVSTTVFLTTLWLMRSFWVARVFPAGVPSRVVGLSLILGLINLTLALLTGIFSGLQRFRELTILTLLQATTVAIFVLGLAVYGSEGAVLAYVVGAFISVILGLAKLWFLERRMLAWPGVSAFRELRVILAFSVPLWVAAFALAPFLTFSFVFLVRQSNGISQLGIFNTANGLRMLVTVMPTAIATVIAPLILQEGGVHGDKAAYAKLIDKGFSALIFLTVPLLVPCLFLSDLIFTLYGKAYNQSIILFIPLTASAAIGAIGTLLPTVMMAHNRTWWALVFGLIKSVLMVVLVILWVPSFLAAGLAWSFVVSETAIYVMVLEFCIHREALPSSLRATFYSSIAFIFLLMAMAMVLPKVARWGLAIPLTAVVVIYYLRAHSEMATWLTNLVPASFKPRARQILAFIAA